MLLITSIIIPQLPLLKHLFMGQVLSVFQLPSHSCTGIARDPIIIDGAPLKEFSITDEYTNVPAVSCKTDKLSLSQLVFNNKAACFLGDAKVEEEEWFQHSIQLLKKKNLVKDILVSI